MCELGKPDLMLKSSGTCHLSNSRTRGVAPRPTHALRGTVKGRKRFFYDTLARVWSSGDPRRFRALREVDALYGVRCCQHRKSRRSHVNARARTAA
jgi:hypothetical protein